MWWSFTGEHIERARRASVPTKIMIINRKILTIAILACLVSNGNKITVIQCIVDDEAMIIVIEQ